MKDVYLRNSTIEHLGFTFHAGEDFLDIADGLRAIDETILYLAFQRGDRLGHALALGINPRDYYHTKNGSIIIPKQDLLDNIVWILAKIKQYDIHTSPSLIQELNATYVRLYQEIYDGQTLHVGRNVLHETLQSGSIQKEQIQELIYNAINQITEIIPHQIYYQSWLLRGDNPELYFNSITLSNQGGFTPITFWDKCSLNETAEEFNAARKNRIARELYKAYYFSMEAKERGAENEEFKISTEYIQLIEETQTSMAFDIAKRHIVIESNPTSNRKIGTYNRKYSLHPMVRFFNLGLTMEMDKIRSCPQLSVSLNTDDQGVFATSREKEYALMAIGLEKEKDENGESLYNSRMIYDWLNRIRKMESEQRFKKDNRGILPSHNHDNRR